MAPQPSPAVKEIFLKGRETLAENNRRMDVNRNLKAIRAKAKRNADEKKDAYATRSTIYDNCGSPL